MRVGRHALEQFLARWPESLAPEVAGQVIAKEVAEALVDGRYSTKEPRWAQRDSRRRSVGVRNGGKERDRTLRYAWTEDKMRLYLVDKAGDVTYVVTAIAPAPDTLCS